MELTLLALVKLANTGVLLWNAAGPLLQSALEAGKTTVTMDEVEAAAVQLGHDLDDLRAAIAAAREEPAA